MSYCKNCKLAASNGGKCINCYIGRNESNCKDYIPLEETNETDETNSRQTERRH